MTKCFSEEFRLIDDIIASCHRSRGVDAFVLAYVRASRQMRKIFTYLAYQASCFQKTGPDDNPSEELKTALAKNTRIDIWDFETLIERLSDRQISVLVGSDYDRLKERWKTAKMYRRKIFHGQITNEKVDRCELIELVSDIRDWCEQLAEGAQREFGYDGFERNSLKKRGHPGITEQVNKVIPTRGDFAKMVNP